jgi:hypothetical protein
MGLFIDLKFEKNLTNLFLFEILVGIGVGMDIEPPMIAAQAAATPNDTAAVVATMGFLRSITNAIAIVLGGVVFQNDMNVSNVELAVQLGNETAAQFTGNRAAASVDAIGLLPVQMQVVVRQAYFRALQKSWILVCPLVAGGNVCFANETFAFTSTWLLPGCHWPCPSSYLLIT